MPLGCDLAQFHGVIRHQAVSAFDELHGGFTLADAAVAHDEHAFAVHLHQHAVTG